MYELTFYKENNFLLSNFYDKNFERNKLLSNSESFELVVGLSEDKDKITNICFIGKDLSFNIGNIRIILKDRNKFIGDENFGFIFNKIKSKRYKITNKIPKTVMLIALAGALSFVSLATINAYGGKKYDNKENNTVTSYYVDLDKENEMNNSISLVETEKIIKKDNEITDMAHQYSGANQEENKLAINYLNLGLKKDSEKLLFVKENYGNVIGKYSKMYDLDADLICAIATQERGVHSSTVDEGGAIGLMQIQVSVWNGSKISVYNYDTGKNETIDVTLEKLKDVDFNIKTGCAIFQNYLKQMNGNIVAATQAYNMGPGTMRKILANYSYSSGKTIDEILDDTDDLNWMEYRNSSYAGDPDYIEHVFRYYAKYNLNELQTGIKK